METSQRMTSGSSRLATATPARPFEAESGLKPSISRIRTRVSNVAASSSITRIFFILPLLLLLSSSAIHSIFHLILPKSVRRLALNQADQQRYDSVEDGLALVQFTSV